MSDIGALPRGWEMVRLGDVGVLQYGFTASATKENTGIKFLRITDITDNGIEWPSVPYCELNEIEFEKYELKKGDILFARIGSTTGKTCFIDRKLKGVFASYLIRFQSSTEDIDAKFVHFYTQSRFYWLQVNRNKEAQLKKGINAKVLGSLRIFLPPLPEQRRIAEVLGTLDSAIQKVGGAIERTERLKRELLQRLLTEGISHERFKETKVGKVPEEWEVVRLVHANIEVIDGDRGANYPKQPDFSDKGFCLFLNAKNVTKNGFKLTETQFISKEKDYKMGKGKLKISDIILTTRGTIGNVGFYNEGFLYEHVRINSGMVILRTENRNIDHKFLYLLFRTPFLKTQIKSIAYGTAQPQLNVRIIKNLMIPLPPIPEQHRIAEILSTVDKKLELERRRKEKLERVKKGLMNELLTGRKRVNVGWDLTEDDVEIKIKTHIANSNQIKEK